MADPPDHPNSGRILTSGIFVVSVVLPTLVPSMKKSTEAETVEWEVRCASLELFIGSTFDL